jgi:hypothetical protein
LLKRDFAGFVASIPNNATNEWTFAHELGHVLGVIHGDKPGKIWSVGSVSQGNAGYRATSPSSAKRATLMHSGNNADHPRMPVLSNRVVEWIPGSPRVPTNQAHRVDGTLVPPSTTSLPLGTNAADAAGYLERPWAFGVSPLKRRASHYLPVPHSDLRLVAPFDHATLGTNLFVWMAGSYAAANPTVLDAWRLDFGSTFGASDLGSEVVPASALDAGGFTTTWTATTTLPAGPVYLRLWWRMGPGNAWLFRDLAFNVADTLISCADEDPAYAGGMGACSVTPPGGGAAVPPCEAELVDAGLATERVRLNCDVAAAGLPGGPGNNVFLSARGRHQLWGDYDFWLRGRTHDGQSFCCLYDSHARPVSRVNLQGAPGDEDFDLGGYVASGPPLAPLRPTWPYPDDLLSVQVRALAGADRLYGSPYVGADYLEALLGQHGPDTIEPGPGFDLVNTGLHADIVVGVGDDKVVVDQGGYDIVNLGPGWHRVCDADGQNDVTTGSDAAWLYVSQGYAPGTVSLGAGSACGWAAAPGSLPAWAPAACTNALLTAPTECNEDLICPGGGCVP